MSIEIEKKKKPRWKQFRVLLAGLTSSACSIWTAKSVSIGVGCGGVYALHLSLASYMVALRFARPFKAALRQLLEVKREELWS